ncbi:nitroreductase family protein [Oceanicoccus sagamiensis]|uniref:Nitroreductase domain-containing protein n=1 Tax=Oceanicoccus sagamiensis TaxID=716816 RepID=A0A1X9NE54_9GAMM|nr:nitroreductase family protein [Oceanicoccus sagamiensis]ARN74712.1 hypothetical protein BST96_11615 [Oceanicoccus sagamiensis]
MSEQHKDFSVRDAVDTVAPLFVNRWSPRAYLQEAISDQDLATIFDAARWSPSCFNEQPWQFITSTPTSYGKFLSLLVDANQAWAKTAPLIGFVVASKTFARNGNENMHADFDTGSAWMAVNLQALKLGYYAHGMGGIEYDQVYQAFDIDPATHQVICGFTLGKVNLAADEEITTRKPLADIWRQV